MKLLKGDAMYATLYRHTSAISHVSDFGAHFSLDEEGEMVWEIELQVDGFEAPSYAARELLWAAANRINERLGLGYAALLAPHKLTRAQVTTGRVQANQTCPNCLDALSKVHVATGFPPGERNI
jgi:hypothetical protein